MANFKVTASGESLNMELLEMALQLPATVSSHHIGMPRTTMAEMMVKCKKKKNQEVVCLEIYYLYFK
jgi:hypothetical protein